MEIFFPAVYRPVSTSMGVSVTISTLVPNIVSLLRWEYAFDLSYVHAPRATPSTLSPDIISSVTISSDVFVSLDSFRGVLASCWRW